MKILQISSGDIKIPPEKGGAIELHILSISREFIKSGNGVTILDRRYTKGDLPTEIIDGVDIKRLDCHKVKFDIFRKINFFRIVSKIEGLLNEVNFAFKVHRFIIKNLKDFDVVHVHLPIIGIVVFAINIEVRKKLIYTSHLNTFMLDKASLADSVYMHISAYLMRHINKVIALNYDLKCRFIQGYGVSPESISIIPNGVDTNIFKPDQDVDYIKQKYYIKGKIVILCVGRITKSKGTEYLIKAIDLIVNKYNCNEAVFLLVGPHGEFGSGAIDQYFLKISKLIAKNKLENYVKLPGSVPFDDLKILYAACDIFVLPSLYEAFAMAVTEAMSSEKPVICTNITGLNTQVKDGWNGFLVEPADSVGLADKIKILIYDEEKRIKMGKNGREFVEENLTWKKVSEKLLEIYAHEKTNKHI